MAVKTNFTKEELNEILSNYDLGEFMDSKPFTDGTVQTNIMLQTTKDKFVFRYYEGRSEKSVLFESNLIKYLKDKKYSCPDVFKNKQGSLLGIYNKKPYVIFEFVEGSHIETPDENQKHQLIEKVAELHNITKDYRPVNIKYRWNFNTEFCKSMAEEKSEKINTNNSREKLKWYLEQLSKLKLPKSLPKGICHCDFHYSNVLYKDGRFNALIDFDDANFTYLLFDLVCLLQPFKASFDWDTWSKFKINEDVFDFGEAKKIVKEYCKYRQLNNNERTHLFDVYKLSVLIDCIWYFEREDVKDFFEKRKIDYLDNLGREKFYKEIFG